MTKNKGYISVEVIIVAAIILCFGAFTTKKFVSTGKETSDEQNKTFSMVLKNAGAPYQPSNPNPFPDSGGSTNKPSSLGLNPNDVITVGDRKYVILKDNGNNQYLIMDINGIGKREFNTDGNGQNPEKCNSSNENCNNAYEGSNIDQYLDGEYFTSLSTEIQQAIVETNIQ